MNWLSKRFELSRGDANNERAMEGLRGFAVFLVFLVHFVTLVTPFISGNTTFLVFAKALHTVGNTGVDLFFVLSGYLIYGSLISRPQQFWRFMSRRLVRIYPAFIVVFAAYVILSFVFPAESKIPSPWTQGVTYLVKNLLLLPGLFAIEPLITVAWSLSYEMFYYLAIPLLISLCRLRDRSRSFRVVLFVSVATLMAVYCGLKGGHVRLIMFVSGILLYEAVKSQRIPSPPGYLGGMALLVGLFSTLISIQGSAGNALKVSILFIAFFILCLACFRNPSSWLPRAFSWTPLRWLGNMSYSYYLLHGLALKAGFLAISLFLPSATYGSWLFWALLPPMFSLTLISSAVLFLLVERPFSLVPHVTQASDWRQNAVSRANT